MYTETLEQKLQGFALLATSEKGNVKQLALMIDGGFLRVAANQSNLL
jgi:hypothetical protein